MLEDAQAFGWDPTVNERAAIAVGYIEAGPKLKPGSEFYWEAFFDLGSERPPAMAGAMPIPFGAIVSYAEYWGCTQAQSDRLIKVIRAVDAWYIREVMKRQRADSE